MSNPKIFLGMPIYGQMPMGCVHSLCRASHMSELHIHARAGQSLVTLARNGITADFLASDCDRLLFIDSDIIYQTEQIERLISKRDLEIVGGVCPLKERGELKWCVRNGGEPNKDGMAMVEGIGAGFLLIHRAVFEKMIKEGVAPAYQSDEGGKRIEHDFWQAGVIEGHYFSEDYYFCHLARKLGFNIWADCGIVLQHVGAATWPLPHQLSK